MSSKDPQNQQKWCPKLSQKHKKHKICQTWNSFKTIVFTVVWAYPAPLGDTLGIKNAFRRRHTDVPSNFYWFWWIWGALGGSRGGPTNHLFVHIFASAPLGGVLEGAGSPKDAHGHKNDVKIDPKTNKMTPKSTPILTKQLHNKIEKYWQRITKLPHRTHSIHWWIEEWIETSVESVNRLMHRWNDASLHRPSTWGHTNTHTHTHTHTHT